MGVASSLLAALGAVDCEFVAPVVVAPRTHEVDHIWAFMFAATSPYASLGAVGCESVAPVVVAPRTRKVDHFRAFVFAAKSRLISLGAAGCAFLASGIFASCIPDVDESMRFAVHCATCRCLPLRAIIRACLLYWEAFLAIRHIIPKCIKYVIYTWP
jgi:hypothetical protein